MSDTIAAISTALGVGAISIIRVSGENSIDIVSRIFKGDNLIKASSHTIHYGHIIDNGEMIDEVLISVMRKPKTFTKENIVEINCHGGIATTNKVLEILLNNGVRLAEPGEFTKRAFLNGRIDLVEAEGIMDLINSKTEINRKISINKLNGKASKEVKELRDKLIDIISNIEVNIDYPEYEDIEVITNNDILPKVNLIIDNLKKIIKASEDGKIINEGINVGIIGKPNVGKSSLLNSLLEEEKAIVTDIEGTTRDIVEGKIVVGGTVLNIIDTAGIRKTDNVVEKIGVDKSIDIIDKADLILFVLNNNEELTNEELNLLKDIENKNAIIIINKIDLDNKLKIPSTNKKIIEVSVIKDFGINEIKEEIKKMYNLDLIATEDLTYLSNARSISLLKQALNKLNSSIYSIKSNAPIDIVELDLKNAWELLGEITGETYSNELLDELFSRFCLGK